MMKAIWNDRIIAESDETINVEGNEYFPRESVNTEFLKNSKNHTVCHWKGSATYYDVIVNGEVNKDAAWYYPSPSSLADKTKNYVAFWRGVKIEK
ncbi:DUF427 domain-containing protein [Lentimicrobium sp. S6]|nr:DUF427 domain-containing protein [Lentimicrobium sp. S6]